MNFCPYCGKPVESRYSYCPSCGEYIEDVLNFLGEGSPNKNELSINKIKDLDKLEPFVQKEGYIKQEDPPTPFSWSMICPKCGEFINENYIDEMLGDDTGRFPCPECGEIVKEDDLSIEEYTNIPDDSEDRWALIAKIKKYGISVFIDKKIIFKMRRHKSIGFTLSYAPDDLNSSKAADWNYIFFKDIVITKDYQWALVGTRVVNLETDEEEEKREAELNFNDIKENSLLAHIYKELWE